MENNKNNKSQTEEIEYLNDYLKFFCSPLAQKIFVSLDSEGNYVKYLHETTKSKSRGKTNECLNKLENIGFVERGTGKRVLNPIGNVIKIKFDEFIKLLLAIKRNKTYWETHLINIPDRFLPYLYVFHDADIISTTLDDNMKVSKIVENGVIKSDHFYAVISGYSENYGKIVENMLKHNYKVEITINRNLYDNVLSRETKTEIEKMMKNYKNARIYLSEDFDKFTMLFTDKEVFLFLFKKNGNIEWDEFLHSKNEESVILAREIFEFYKEKATEI